MKSLHCAGAGRVTLVEVPDPEPRPGHVLVRVEASAICGSERAALTDGSGGNAGHEACGVVVDPGSSSFRIGERVGMSAVTGCGECDRCRAGEELHCRPGLTTGFGWHAEYVAIAASSVRVLPDGSGPTVGALMTGDALGVPARAYHRVPSQPGARVVVIGLGPVGLSHVVLRTFTGADVVAIGSSPYRRDLARSLGATEVLEPGADLGGDRPSLVIECSGRPEAIARAFNLIDNGGTVLQSGECYSDVPVNPSEAFIRREITYTGSWYYARSDYDGMRALIDSGLPIERLCTHEVDAADAQEAVTDFLEGRAGKVVLHWS